MAPSRQHMLPTPHIFGKSRLWRLDLSLSSAHDSGRSQSVYLIYLSCVVHFCSVLPRVNSYYFHISSVSTHTPLIQPHILDYPNTLSWSRSTCLLSGSVQRPCDLCIASAHRLPPALGCSSTLFTLLLLAAFWSLFLYYPTMLIEHHL